jgi:hypothetical protein
MYKHPELNEPTRVNCQWQNRWALLSTRFLKIIIIFAISILVVHSSRTLFCELVCRDGLVTPAML